MSNLILNPLGFKAPRNCKQTHTVDGRNPAPVDVVDIPVFICIHRVLYIPGGARFLPPTVSLVPCV